MYRRRYRHQHVSCCGGVNVPEFWRKKHNFHSRGVHLSASSAITLRLLLSNQTQSEQRNHDEEIALWVRFDRTQSK
jgi:hypothetical protein